ncbi:MAG: thermonuclease family protein [Pseudomonadota bacterium]
MTADAARRISVLWAGMAAIAGLFLGAALMPAPARAEACLRGGSVDIALAGLKRRDTLTVASGGTIRLADLDLPNMAMAPDPGVAELEREASNWLVFLASGKPAAKFYPIRQDPDHHGRLPGHVLLAQAGSAGEPWLQAALVEKGYARVVPESGRQDCLTKLLALERGARSRGAGLWQFPSYAVKSAAQVSQFLYSYQITRDRLVKTRVEGKRVIYTLGARRGPAFDVDVPEKIAEALAAKAQPASDAGRLLEVRGWIDEGEERPVIKVEHPAQIELAKR